MSTKPQATKPAQNMAEINKLLEEATKKLAFANNEIDSLKTQLAQEQKNHINALVMMHEKDFIIKDLSRAIAQLTNERKSE